MYGNLIVIQYFRVFEAFLRPTLLFFSTQNAKSWALTHI